MGMTSFTAFRVRRRFELDIEDWNPNDSGRIELEEGIHLTRDLSLLDHLQERWGEIVEIDPERQRFPGAAPVSRWPELKNFRGKVLIVSPSRAIGDSIMFLCALAAVKDANPALELGVAFVAGAHRAFEWDPGIAVHAYAIHESEIKQYQGLVDLLNLEELSEQVYTPFDVEKRLLEAFDVPPSPRLPGIGRPPRDPGRPKINLFPLASDPLRTIPPEATRAIAGAVSEFGPVNNLLNPLQLESQPYADAISDGLPANVTITMKAMRFDDLIQTVSETDYGLFSDSAPCHIAKLYDVMGFAVFTTIPAEVRVGRYRNFRVWQAKYRGRHCKAPCGLALLLTTPSGQRGCWETLGPDHRGYRRSRVIGDEKELLGFTFERPVPCVAAVRDKASALAKAVADDIRTRLLDRGEAPAGAEGVR